MPEMLYDKCMDAKVLRQMFELQGLYCSGILQDLSKGMPMEQALRAHDARMLHLDKLTERYAGLALPSDETTITAKELRRADVTNKISLAIYYIDRQELWRERMPYAMLLLDTHVPLQPWSKFSDGDIKGAKAFPEFHPNKMKTIEVHRHCLDAVLVERVVPLSALERIKTNDAELTQWIAQQRIPSQ